MRPLSRAGRAGLDAVVLLAVLGFLSLAVGPHLLDYRPVTMLTGSMAPAIPPGAVLLASFVPRESVQVGDVITLQAPTGSREVVTHRVTEVSRRGDAVLVQTRGDGNALPDPWVAELEGDVLRTSTVLPFVGHALAALQDPDVSRVLARGLPAVLLVGLLVTVWRRPTRPAGPRLVPTGP